MKKIGLLIVAFIMSMGMVMAQPPQRGERKKVDPKERAEKMTDRMTEKYGLNDTQKGQLLTLNMTMTEKMADKHPGRKHRDAKAVKPERKKDEANKTENAETRKAEREKRMAEMKESRQAYDAKVKEIFTAEQYEKYQANIAERQQKAKERGKDGHRNHRPERKAKA